VLQDPVFRLVLLFRKGIVSNCVNSLIPQGKPRMSRMVAATPVPVNHAPVISDVEQHHDGSELVEYAPSAKRPSFTGSLGGVSFNGPINQVVFVAASADTVKELFSHVWEWCNPKWDYTIYNPTVKNCNRIFYYIF